MLKEHSSAALITVVQHALTLYQKPEVWRQLQMNAMSGDFSWQSSAESYIALYEQALQEGQSVVAQT